MAFDIATRGGAVEVKQSRQAEDKAHGHGLPIVKFGMWGPPRVVDMCFVPVGEVRAAGCGYAHYGKEDGAGTEHSKDVDNKTVFVPWAA